MGRGGGEDVRFASSCLRRRARPVLMREPLRQLLSHFKSEEQGK